jgi:dienelactone hydrolase
MRSMDAFAPSICHQTLLAANCPAVTFDDSAVGAWQRKARKRIAARLGFDRISATPRVPLKVRTLWTREHELGTISKIRFWCEAKAEAIAFVCIPKGASGKLPWMVCLQGHTTGAHVSIGVERDDNAKTFTVEGDRDFGLECLRNGVAAVCLEQRSFGERRELAMETPCGHNGCHDAAMHAMMLGRTLAGERVFDVDRVLDYLETRKDVDWKRVGVMGNSGGGTITTYAAALLPRLTFAMPSCSFCTYAGSIMAVYHCGDNYVPGILLDVEMADVLGCLAPKPVVVVTGAKDPLFPLPAVRKAFAHLKRIYTAAGAPNACRLVVGPEGHRFYAALGWKAARPLFGV